MRVSKLAFLLHVCLLIAFFALLKFLKQVDPSGVTMHLVGSGIVVASFVFIKKPLPRVFQLFAVTWLLGDIVLANWFGARPAPGVDASAWRNALAAAYVMTLVLLGLYDRLQRSISSERGSRKQAT